MSGVVPNPWGVFDPWADNIKSAELQQCYFLRDKNPANRMTVMFEAQSESHSVSC